MVRVLQLNEPNEPSGLKGCPAHVLLLLLAPARVLRLAPDLHADTTTLPRVNHPRGHCCLQDDGIARRSDLVISTKIFWGGAMAGVKGNPNAVGLSRKHLIEGMKDSLQRLQLECVMPRP